MSFLTQAYLVVWMDPQHHSSDRLSLPRHMDDAAPLLWLLAHARWNVKAV